MKVTRGGKPGKVSSGLGRQKAKNITLRVVNDKRAKLTRKR